MKLTGQMVYDALAASVVNGEPRYDDAAGILYAQLNPDELTFTLDYAEDEDSLIATDFEDLLRLINKHGVEGDYICICVQDEDFNEIGSGQFYYKQGDKFLEAIESYGAAIGLEKTLSEMETEARKAQASA